MWRMINKLWSNSKKQIAPPTTEGFLLLENSGNILLESLDRLLLE
jgi:hypothetical protein